MGSAHIFFYSVLNASTASFFAAILEGIIPAISVSVTLNKISSRLALIGSAAKLLTPVKDFIILFAGNINKLVIKIPREPESRPTITVSALNTLDISFLLAPILFRIPISFCSFSGKVETYALILSGNSSNLAGCISSPGFKNGFFVNTSISGLSNCSLAILVLLTLSII